MTTNIILSNYGLIISDKILGEKIYNDIKEALGLENRIEIDLAKIKSMATFNAKQIFGRLYLELGSQNFFERIRLKNASENIKLIIRMGVKSAVEESLGNLE